MILQDQNILFFARTMKLGGTENVILQLCEIFKPLVNKIIVCSCGGVNLEILHSMNIKHYIIGDLEDKSPMKIIETCRKIKRIVADEHITIIHTHHRMAAFYVRLTGLYKYCKFINTSHNTFLNRRILTRFAYKKAALIACGEMVKKNLTDVFGLTDVTVIHNAVRPFNGEVTTEKTFEDAKAEGKFLIGNVGRLSEQKGMEYFIRAIPSVLAMHPDTQFYIIGAGEDEDKLKEMGIGLPVTFMGYRNDIQNLMSQLDLIVLSSLWEGFPLTPIEAFSVGKTIVATGVDGTLEIVKDKENGVLIEPKNSDAISKKVNWLIEHPDELKRMEKRARESFENEFSFDILAQSYADYYLRSL